MPQGPAFEAEPPEGQIAVGRVVGAWGIQGHLKVEVMTDFLDRFLPGASLNLRGRSHRILDVKQRRQQLLVRLTRIATPEAAAAQRGTLLTIDEAELGPLGEGEFYRFQLVGLAVIDQNGAALGSVEEILDTGETQVLVVRGDSGEVLIPLVEGFVSEVDLAKGQVAADTTDL
ncbi:MAG: ribosome maturation factor RimM [Dehalococcoidia bacterium]